jgi:hypothetical protein
MSELTTFLIGLAIIALILERAMETFFGWLPEIIDDKLKEGNKTGEQKKSKFKGGFALTLLILFFGFIIALYGELFVLKEIFSKDFPDLLDAFITGLFISGGADPIHQVIRFTEEKKDKAKEEKKEIEMRNKAENEKTIEKKS